MDISQFTLSHHAQQRILDMGVDPQEVIECLTQPDHVGSSRKYPDAHFYYAGRIICPVSRDNMTVVTVLWQTELGWKRDIEFAGEYGGRSYRGRTA